MNDIALSVQMIPINQINVLNPRSRNKTVFQSIVSNIFNLGLKKPITVARRLEAMTRPSFCTRASERVYITAQGCETLSGDGYGLPAAGAGGR